MMFKNVYRYPLMVGLTPFYEQVLPAKISKSKQSVKACTGVSIAVIEGLILNPFERLKTYFMTVNYDIHGKEMPRETFKSWYSKTDNVVKDLLRGSGTFMVRQAVAWTVWLEADHYSRTKIRQVY